MAGRGPQSFKKRQKEQQRKEKQEEKRAKRLDRKRNPHLYVGTDDDAPETDIDMDNDADNDADNDKVAPENGTGIPVADKGKAT
jgi:hypothetical protein